MKSLPITCGSRLLNNLLSHAFVKQFRDESTSSSECSTMIKVVELRVDVLWLTLWSTVCCFVSVPISHFEKKLGSSQLSEEHTTKKFKWYGIVDGYHRNHSLQRLICEKPMRWGRFEVDSYSFFRALPIYPCKSSVPECAT